LDLEASAPAQEASALVVLDPEARATLVDLDPARMMIVAPVRAAPTLVTLDQVDPEVPAGLDLEASAPAQAASVLVVLDPEAQATLVPEAQETLVPEAQMIMDQEVQEVQEVQEAQMIMDQEIQEVTRMIQAAIHMTQETIHMTQETIHMTQRVAIQPHRLCQLVPQLITQRMLRSMQILY